MARKKAPYATIETKEEFDNWFDKIYKEGRNEGFHEGSELTLALFIDLINEKFDDETIRNAQAIANNIAKARTMSKFKKKEGDMNESDTTREGRII